MATLYRNHRRVATVLGTTNFFHGEHNCTAQVIAADSFALARGVREPYSDRKMPIHVGDFFVPRSIPTIQDKSVWRGGEVVRRATDHTSEPSLMDFFFERKVSFVKKNAANNASTM